MATLSIDRRSGKTSGYNIQWYEDKRRRTIHLGSRRYSKKTAERLQEVVEKLLYYRRNGIIVPDKATEHWLQNAPACIKSKLAKMGLITVNEPKTCQSLWDTFLKHKNVKPKTVKGYLDSQRQFFTMFSPSEPIEKITSDRLLEWKTALLDRFAVSSVALHLTNIKAVLNWAVRRDWLPKSPAKDIASGSFANEDKDRTISMAEYAKLLEACPNQEWRTIIALARIGGLRCPSELQRLKWSDIDRARNRFLVHSTKTERHENHRRRVVPLFSELWMELDRLFSLSETSDSEYVIRGFQGTSWTLGDPFQKIADRAELGTIERPFDNMRMSRSNEVFERWGPAKENLWIGHSEAVRRKHYKGELSDESFAEAAGIDLGAPKTHAKSHARVW